jgi:hypothetical protein
MSLACNGKTADTEHVADEEVPESVDSAAFYRNFIIGKWFLPGDNDVVMQIKPMDIDFGDGVLISRYRFAGLHKLVLDNPDGSTDTVAVRINRDTLFVKSNHESQEASYVRKP